MTNLEQVKKLKEHADITYEEAKEVLERANGDILEAVIILERENRMEPPKEGGYYRSAEEPEVTPEEMKKESQGEQSKDKADRISFGEVLGDFFRWAGKMLHKGNVNSLRVEKDGESIMMIPITLLVLLLFFAFWVVIPVSILGLVLGYRYRFQGADFEKTKVNETVDKVSDATLRAVDSVTQTAKDTAKDFRKKDDEKNGEHTDH
ncbi:DUF4342 domain-containing protein [Isachenkonia alkalipeptolytica]|uniref:DUF4342 domain-containing protein n=1 Tax=Isachenkonia alkalipeptolytica TaxID=2565777 RepID=A0AA43XK56_9CLOT|nr:DUF4342 domain-containing protein [Isachenkonia alkalipeptolytica]NBG87669.1 DUF4342 domain-containing protein [Isachenkonia alkalipeptolytica]